MKTLLNTRRKRSTDRTRDRRQQRHRFLDVARQSSNNQNTDHQQQRTDEQQQLRPATNRNEIKRGVRAAEDQHLAEVFQRKEGDERQYCHHEQRHDVTRARNTPVSLSQILVARRQNAREPDEEGNLRRFPRRHVAEGLSGTRGYDGHRQRQQRKQDDDEAVALEP